MKYIKVLDTLYQEGGCSNDCSFLLEVEDDKCATVVNDLHDIVVNDDDSHYETMMDYIERTEGVTKVVPIVPDVVIEW